MNANSYISLLHQLNIRIIYSLAEKLPIMQRRKNCKRCGENKILKRFAIRPNNHDAHNNICDTCQSLENKERKAKKALERSCQVRYF